ncbi:MAG TPA: alpha-amylase family protein [Streptosporangiaceae bacterium]|nr:alpha-amylase family protein [Streptosporangiaceae bacterium]
MFRLDPAAEDEVRRRLGHQEADAFLARLEHLSFDIAEPLGQVYGGVADLTGFVTELVLDALKAAAERPMALRLLDRRREIDPAWFQRSRMVGYVCYADRFAGSLAGVRRHLDYLAELGVTYLHLLPLLRPREGENDGGYAVEDYDAVDPRAGSMADLEALAGDLRERGIALCVDLVLNHTAREHEWARKAVAGEPAYREMYLVYPDRTQPDAYERTLPEVFPDTAPGSFTKVPGLGWVWTTFHDYQWDLNYANPAVFRAMLGTMLALANHGIDVLRLDAAPFLWKRMGTDCQNQPEAHLLLQAFRGLARLAVPGLVLEAEAIVGPDMLVQYLGGHDRYRPECDLAYDNQLMVMLWSTLATRDVRLAEHALARRRPPPVPTAWVSYLRCHDDIGWAVSDADAASAGLGGPAHRRFLSDFYAGRFPGSFARGALFQENPVTGDARVSGTAASLCGIESALAAGDPDELTHAARRLESMYAVVFSFGGIPLIYMGDELGMCNDPRWREDPAHAGDNRWMHRPPMDWSRAARRSDPGTLEGRVFAAIQGLADARRSLLALRSGGVTEILPAGNPAVLAYRRVHPRSAPFLSLTNFSDTAQSADAGVIARAGLQQPRCVRSTSGDLVIGAGRIELPAWGFAWLTGT